MALLFADASFLNVPRIMRNARGCAIINKWPALFGRNLTKEIQYTTLVWTTVRYMAFRRLNLVIWKNGFAVLCFTATAIREQLT